LLAFISIKYLKPFGSLALLKNAKISKLGIKNQRLQAAWDESFLEKAFAFFLTVSQ